jgi:hypothetical protein
MGYIPDSNDQFDTWHNRYATYLNANLAGLCGPPPTDLSQCQFLATDTRTAYMAVFDGPEANQTAHFIGRWMSTRIATGPLGEAGMVTVPG